MKVIPNLAEPIQASAPSRFAMLVDFSHLSHLGIVEHHLELKHKYLITNLEAYCQALLCNAEASYLNHRLGQLRLAAINATNR